MIRAIIYLGTSLVSYLNYKNVINICVEESKIPTY